MPTINLIHDQRRAYRQRLKASRLWFTALLGAAISTGGLTAMLLIGSISLNGEAKSLQAKAEELKPYREAIEQSEQALTQLSPRLTTLTSARTDTERWTRILEHMSYVMPTNTWLTGVRSVASNEENAPVEVSLTGMSGQQESVGELMLRLQSLSDIANVRLRYTEEKKTQFGEGLEFQIVCDVPTSSDSNKETKNDSTRS
jgi:Tfp pilus assembly protein PilN